MPVERRPQVRAEQPGGARASTAVPGSAVITSRSRSTPRTMACATEGAERTFTAAEIRAVASGFSRFSRARPGVSVSGG